MKKYKHKGIGFIAELNPNGVNYILKENRQIPEQLPLWVVENSNDWEEVVEKEFEVLELTKPYSSSYSGVIIKPKQDLEACLKLGWNINSIKRLSDGIIFKVGDKVTISKLYKPIPFVISKFYFDCNNIHLLCNGECCGNGHVSITKIEHYKEPIFITEDQAPIYEGESYWYTYIDTPCCCHCGNATLEYQFPNTIKRFSTKEACYAYNEEIKPAYSKKQIRDILEMDSEAYNDGEIIDFIYKLIDG